jgi:hypothetical protein
LLKVAVPNEVEPSKNSTEPAGIPVAGATADTETDNDTAFENTDDGSGSTVNTVLVEAVFTTWSTAADVLAVKEKSPEYTAVNEWVPTVNPLVEIDAWPAPLTGMAPSDVAPSKNSTLPTGTPAPGAVTLTCAETVTCSPNNDGFGAEVTTVVVAAWFTVCTIEPIDVEKSTSPE